MNISFQKEKGNLALDIAFTWMMTLQADSPVAIIDHFIPELFYDYFFVKEGEVRCVDEAQGTEFLLPSQALKTLYTHPLKFVFSVPLILFGARLSLGFAESFWGEMKANCFLEQKWVGEEADDLETFTSRVTGYLQKHRKDKWPYPLFSHALEESGWLVNFSPRHKRRLYKSTFGISKKELWSIQNVHSFLEQNCEFEAEYPRIIQHVNAEVFHDQPHLNHAFKKMTGLSPLEYFEVNSILQDNLMAASYNENSDEQGRI
jgi:AraC-like DNA-binding protein